MVNVNLGRLTQELVPLGDDLICLDQRISRGSPFIIKDGPSWWNLRKRNIFQRFTKPVQLALPSYIVMWTKCQCFVSLALQTVSWVGETGAPEEQKVNYHRATYPKSWEKLWNGKFFPLFWRLCQVPEQGYLLQSQERKTGWWLTNFSVLPTSLGGEVRGQAVVSLWLHIFVMLFIISCLLNVRISSPYFLWAGDRQKDVWHQKQSYLFKVGLHQASQEPEYFKARMAHPSFISRNWKETVVEYQVIHEFWSSLS